jgi:hypothetical protein
VPPDWATTIATMIGDPDKDAEELLERSPVTYADQITAPLLVIQGEKDPRVPKAESDQIVARARANGAEVEYLVFEDEGHGFSNRENDIKAHTAIVEFLVKHLRLDMEAYRSAAMPPMLAPNSLPRGRRFKSCPATKGVPATGKFSKFGSCRATVPHVRRPAPSPPCRRRG